MPAISDTQSCWPPVIILLVIARSKATKQSSGTQALDYFAERVIGHIRATVGTQRRFKIRGMIVYQAIISGANPIPPGAIRMADRRGGAAGERGVGPRRMPARSRVPANKRLGRQLACDAQATTRGEDVAPRRAAAVRFKKPATGFPTRAQFLRC